MEEQKFEKKGYLYDDFRMFHLKEKEPGNIGFHYHDFYKILIFISGSVNYIVEGKNYKLKPFDIVLVNRNEIHRPEVDAKQPYERVVFYISENYLEKHKTRQYDLKTCFEETVRQESCVARLPALLNTRVAEIVSKIEENGRQERYAGQLYANVLFMELMILLNRACMEGECSFRHEAVYNQKMIDLLQYINGHLCEDLSIDELAEHIYISKYHMMRQFKEETGYTIHQYITEKRVLRAKTMMQAGISATEACYACGFKDYSTFSRAFKNRMEKSPTELS